MLLISRYALSTVWCVYCVRVLCVCTDLPSHLIISCFLPLLVCHCPFLADHTVTSLVRHAPRRVCVKLSCSDAVRCVLSLNHALLTALFCVSVW